MTKKTSQKKTFDDRHASMNVKTTKLRKDQVVYYSNKHNETIIEFVEKAIDERIGRLNGDYDIPNITVARMQQMADNMELMREEMRLLRQAINNGFGAVLKLTDDD